MSVQSVNIRPGVNVLSVLPHLNYKAWFALAEFVDNSVQSFIDEKDRLKKQEDKTFQLRVDINFEPSANTITIKDNAAGIASSNYSRAFRPAEIPPDAGGLSEFGMGMKSAACWFSPRWSVRSTALGESIERTIFFDIDEIVNDSIEELDVIQQGTAESTHYTEVCLTDIRRFPRGKTIQKIKDHLASIYRIYIRAGTLTLCVDGEELTYEDPEILHAPSFRAPDGPEIEWKKDIAIDLGEGRSASGFVAIRKKGNTRLAGLALFRRKRLILGSVDETYRPEEIFGRSTTFAYQRIFGEIHLRGFAVSHTKDGIKWEEAEDDFLKKLHKELSGEALPILMQAREHKTTSAAKAQRNEAAAALQNTASALSNSDLGTERAESSQPTHDESDDHADADDALPEIADSDVECSELSLHFRNEQWIVRLELSYDPNTSDWLSIRDRPSITDPEPREVLVRIAMMHPFMVQFPTLDSDGFSAVLKIAAAMSLAEIVAGESADRHPSAIRRFTNEILKNNMSQRVFDE